MSLPRRWGGGRGGEGRERRRGREGELLENWPTVGLSSFHGCGVSGFKGLGGQLLTFGKFRGSGTKKAKIQCGVGPDIIEMPFAAPLSLGLEEQMKGRCTHTVQNGTELRLGPSPETDRSARSGAQPSVQDHPSLGPATSDAANERPHEMANIRIHLCRQASAERRNAGGESFAAANASTNSTASWLNLHSPRRRPDESPSNNSENLASLVAWWLAARGCTARAWHPCRSGGPQSGVDSHCAPCWRGNPVAKTSDAFRPVPARKCSCRRVSHHSERLLQLRDTHSPATVRSLGSALVFKQPERAQLLCDAPHCRASNRTIVH